MKCVILAGGLGTRLSEETNKIPKPMVEIGGKPIIWHIMKWYSYFGIKDFIICCGYKGFMIKEFFYHYYMHNSDMTINLNSGDVEFKKGNTENWRVTLVDTGLETPTEGRLFQVKEYVEDSPFCMTYGDGLGNVNLEKLVEFHHCNTSVVTLTAVQPQGRFGNLELENDIVKSLKEKVIEEDSYINGGFFVINPEIFKILDPQVMFEKGALIKLAEAGKLSAYRHNGEWRCMDTLNDKGVLEDLWKSGKAFWKIQK